MSTDVQSTPKVDLGSDKQPRRRSKDTEKSHHRRSAKMQNKKHKHDNKFNKRASGKFFPPYKKRKDFIIPPTKFLLGGNINDPLNLNSLQDEETNRAMNAVTPKSSPLPTPKHRKGEIEVIIPPDITDPLNLTAGDDDAAYEAMLASPVKRTQKKQKKNKKRRSHRLSSGQGSGKEDSVEGAQLNQSDCSINKEEKDENSESVTQECKPVIDEPSTETQQPQLQLQQVQQHPKEQLGPPAKKHKPDSHGTNNRANIRKMELKERKAEQDKIVSPVIPQPGAWGDRHRFRPPPQRTPQINKSEAAPKFKESNAKFQYGNFNRYYGYRNPNRAPDLRLKVLEKHKHLFYGKDLLDIGCNTGHLTLSIARDFGPNKVVGLDIDKTLIQVARSNIRHYVNCGKKNKFFPVSMPIVYGPIDVPGISEDKIFPHNISFVQGNYVLDSDVQLSMEQPQFDVILCLSTTKWIHLNWGDAGLKRVFKRMYSQLRPGGVLILEAQSWSSYTRKKNFTPETWKNYHNIELFPHHFSQYLLSEIGFSKCEVIGAPLHHSRGFQRPIKLFIKEDPSFDTPAYSGSTSVYDSATPRYSRDTGDGAHNFDVPGSYSFRLPDSVHFNDDLSGDSSFPYGTPHSFTSPESGFSEGFLLPRRYPPRVEPDQAGGGLHGQRESPANTPSTSEESRPTSAVKDEILEDTSFSVDSTSQGAVVEGNSSQDLDFTSLDEEKTELAGEENAAASCNIEIVKEKRNIGDIVDERTVDNDMEVETIKEEYEAVIDSNCSNTDQGTETIQSVKCEESGEAGIGGSNGSNTDQETETLQRVKCEELGEAGASGSNGSNTDKETEIVQSVKGKEGGEKKCDENIKITEENTAVLEQNPSDKSNSSDDVESCKLKRHCKSSSETWPKGNG